jgi:hypothetical protein
MNDFVKKEKLNTPAGLDFLEPLNPPKVKAPLGTGETNVPAGFDFADIPVPPLALKLSAGAPLKAELPVNDSVESEQPEPEATLKPSEIAPSEPANETSSKDEVLSQPSAPLGLDPVSSDNVLINGLSPLPSSELTEGTERYVGPKAVGPMKLMASRAMAPLTPRDMIRVIYQLMFDEDQKLGAAALRSFEALDERILAAVLGEYLPPTILLLLSRTLVKKSLYLERVLLNRNTPDEGFVFIGAHCEDPKILSIVSANQERMLRNHDIIRGLAGNLATLRSDLDRAVDFLVREGVFLDDLPHFADAFMRLGKTEALQALENIELTEELLTDDQRVYCEQHGLTAEQLLLGGMRDISSLLEDEELELQTRRRQPLNTYPISAQIKLAMLGDHIYVLEGLHSSNRLVSSAAIRNPKVREADIVKIARMKSIAEDVIRFISGNKDWTKSYQIKFSLVHHPKAPPNMVKRWMPLLRPSDLKTLAKNKQVPTNVCRMAKRLLMTKR